MKKKLTKRNLTKINTKKYKKIQKNTIKRYNKKGQNKMYYGGSKFDISGTSELLLTLNELLRKKCPELEIRVGMLEEMPGELSIFSRNKGSVLFCIYYRNNCISSFQLVEHDEEIEIRSLTHREFQKKRYNLLLTHTVFILTNLINFKGLPINKIVSEVINPNMAQKLMRKFNIYPVMDEDKNPDFMAEIKGYVPEESILEIVSNFYKKWNVPIFFEINLTEELKQESMQNFKLLVGYLESENINQQITCP